MSIPPPLEPQVRKTVTLPQSMWAEVASFRLVEQIGSNMEAMRQLVKAGLAARQGEAVKKS